MTGLTVFCCGNSLISQNRFCEEIMDSFFSPFPTINFNFSECGTKVIDIIRQHFPFQNNPHNLNSPCKTKARFLVIVLNRGKLPCIKLWPITTWGPLDEETYHGSFWIGKLPLSYNQTHTIMKSDVPRPMIIYFLLFAHIQRHPLFVINWSGMRKSH